MGSITTWIVSTSRSLRLNTASVVLGQADDGAFRFAIGARAHCY